MTTTLLDPESICSDSFFARLKALVIETTGLAYYETQELELARQLSQRLEDLQLADCGAYWELVRAAPAGAGELDLLFNRLTIGETSFFRHEEQFRALGERVLPDVLERNRAARRLRIWSAGCANGAEPYSLAILLRQQWGELLRDWDVQILGSDINRTFLAQARQARFGDWALRSTPADVIERCFTRLGSQWLLRPEFRSWVSFQHHNLAQHPFPPPAKDQQAFDIILCRNVLIYFSAELTRRVADQFHQCLTDGGWLVVGHAEASVELFQQFQTTNAAEAVLYRKTSGAPLATGPIVTGARPVPAGVERAALGPQLPRDDDTEEIAGLCESPVRDPFDPKRHLAFALMSEARGHHSAAERALRQAIYLDRKCILAHYHLGVLLQRKADITGASKAFRNALRLLVSDDAGAKFTTADGFDAAALAELTRKHLEAVNSL